MSALWLCTPQAPTSETKIQQRVEYDILWELGHRHPQDALSKER